MIEHSPSQFKVHPPQTNDALVFRKTFGKGRVAQLEKHLPCNPEDLSLIPKQPRGGSTQVPSGPLRQLVLGGRD